MRRIAGLVLVVAGVAVLAWLDYPLVRHGVNGETIFSAGMAIDLLAGMAGIIAIAAGARLLFVRLPGRRPD